MAVEYDPQQDAPAPFAVGEVDETYVGLFVLKHVCANCMGTMAPLQREPSTCVCNRCDATRTEAEFVKRVEDHFAGGEDEDEDEEMH